MAGTLYHRNVAGGMDAKGVECKRCGEYVGLLKSKAGKWYTCQLQGSMNPDSSARNAYPFMPHFRYCTGVAGEYHVSWSTAAGRVGEWEGQAENGQDAKRKAGVTDDRFVMVRRVVRNERSTA